MNLSYQNQIYQLKNFYLLSIPNEKKAISILKTIGYQRLKGYGLEFLDSNNSKYIVGTSIDTIYNIYCFDSKLRNILMPVLETIEIKLKEQISHQISIKYGLYGYLNNNNFLNNQNSDNILIHDIILQKLKKEINKNSKFNNNKKLNIFEAMEFFTFGNVSAIYTILKNEDKKVISNLYDTNPKFLKNWILVLVELRNMCAHYIRIYNNPLKQTPILYKENIKYRTNINKLFPVLLIIKRMSGNNKLWNKFLKNLDEIIEEYKFFQCLKKLGFPKNFDFLGLDNNKKF